MSTNQNNGFSTQDVWILRCQQHFSRSSADSHKKHNTPNRTAASTNQNFNKTIICNIPSLPPLPLPLSLTPQLHPSSATAWPTTQWSEPWLPTIACPTVRMSRECSKSVKLPKVMTAFAKWPCNTWTCVSLKNNQTRRKRKEIQWKDYSWHQSLTWHLPAVSCHVCENKCQQHLQKNFMVPSRFIYNGTMCWRVQLSLFPVWNGDSLDFLSFWLGKYIILFSPLPQYTKTWDGNEWLELITIIQ